MPTTLPLFRQETTYCTRSGSGSSGWIRRSSADKRLSSSKTGFLAGRSPTPPPSPAYFEHRPGFTIAPMPTAFQRTRLPRIVQSRQNARVKELRAAFAQTSRSETGLVAVEGEKLIGEALSSGLSSGAIFV